MIPRLVNTALGLWLIVAPAVLGYSTTHAAASANDRIVGPLVMSAAIVAIWPELRPLRWVNAVFGGWMIIAPWLLRIVTEHPVSATVNDVVVGILLVVVARIRGPLDDEFGGGWRSIWRDDIDTTDPDAVLR